MRRIIFVVAPVVVVCNQKIWQNHNFGLSHNKFEYAIEIRNCLCQINIQIRRGFFSCKPTCDLSCTLFYLFIIIIYLLFCSCFSLWKQKIWKCLPIDSWDLFSRHVFYDISMKFFIWKTISLGRQWKIKFSKITTIFQSMVNVGCKENCWDSIRHQLCITNLWGHILYFFNIKNFNVS